MKQLKKKNKSLAPSKQSSTSIVANQKTVLIKAIAEETDKKIKAGLENPTASTGTRISKLHGAAKFMAQLSNVGEGSVATGGEGIRGGFNTFMKNSAAKAMLKNGPRIR